jgi:RNA polymerase sigma factor (sigma-70 family)
VNPIAAARGSTSVTDGVLVQEAAAGGGMSYAALYDRYSEQVYNYCLRLTGSPHDAADATQDAFVGVLARLQHDERPVLDFASYLFAAARNESYALMRKRSRAQPTDELPDRAASQPDLDTDPERAALLHDAQESVRRANSQLPPRHREVLALREVAGRSYDEIGDIMGISENAAAQLIFRARGKLKEALTAGAVASVVATTDDCEHAQLLITRLQDDEPISDEEHEWLDDHLEHCAACRTARGMVLEMGASYRAWAVVPVLAALRPEVLTRAGEAIGVDWSGVAASTPAGGGGNGSGTDSNGGSTGGNGGGAGGTGGGAGGVGSRVLRPRGHHAAAQGALGAAVLAVTGIVAAGILHDGSPATRDAAPAEQVRPAERPDAGTAATAAKAKSAAPVAQAAGIHGFQNLAAGEGPARQDLPTLAIGTPEKRSSQAPGGREHGRAPDGSPAPKGGQPGPKPGKPEPGRPGQPGPGAGGPGNGPGSGPGGGPGNGPGGGPGNGPGGGPGNGPGGGPGGGQPGPGGGPPANPPGSPGNPPGGGRTDPPGQPTDTGTGPGNPPTGGGGCTWPGRGNGKGPGACPPGHGGVPPGHGGTPPGQGKKPK